MYFIDDNPLDFKQSGLKEGGIVRNTAWVNFLKEKRPHAKIITFKITHRIFKLLNFLFFFIRAIFWRKQTVFFLYPKVGLPILSGGKKGKIFRAAFKLCANMLIHNKNTLVFDISDIKYEQAIDLCLENFDMDEIKSFEKWLFSIKQKYIFASHSMRDYAIKTHNIPYENTDVCVNGGYTENNPQPQNFSFIHEEKITCIYAGTMNKGRLIEEMIKAVSNKDNVETVLLGVGGEWVDEFLKEKNIKNVYYLGAFEESKAREITACCDIGLIPYDDTRLYYNIAYPTKLSFYIAAGIPYLSTPVAEVLRIQEQYNIGFAYKLDEWSSFLSDINSDQLKKVSANAKKYSHVFTWTEIFDKNKFV